VNVGMESIESLSQRAAELYRKGHHEEALTICRSLAESPETPPWILSLIGTMLFHGRGTGIDQDEGLLWYQRAADAGDPGALTFLAGCEQATGRYGAAKALLEEAASQGYLRAVVQLGYLYDRGLGVARDPRRAREYFERAAREGYVFAKRFIAGQLLRGEEGVVGRFKGIAMFITAVVELVRIRTTDRYSEKGIR
jgi:TPR repeat protein